MKSEIELRQYIRKFLMENAESLFIGDPLIDVEMNQMADELGTVPDTLRNTKTTSPNPSKSSTTSKKDNPPAPEKKDSTPNFQKKDVNSQAKKDSTEKASETQEMGNKQDSGKKPETDTKKTWQKPWEKTEKEDNKPKS